jgi:hypothetical protein
VSYGVLACPKCGEAADLGVSMPRFSTRPEHAVDRITCRHCGLMVIPEELVREMRFDILRGGAPSVSSAAVPVTPGPTYTALGVANGVNSAGAGTNDMGSGALYTPGAGNTLVVLLHYDQAFASLSGVKFGTTPMDLRTSVLFGNATNRMLEVYTLQGCPAGSLTIFGDDSLGGPMLDWEMTVVAMNAPAIYDRSISASGHGTAPSSGATPATTQPGELLVGCAAWEGFSPSGTWDNAFTAGQQTTIATNSIEDSSKNVLATGAYTASKTGSTNASWAAACVTFRSV